MWDPTITISNDEQDTPPTLKKYYKWVVLEFILVLLLLIISSQVTVGRLVTRNVLLDHVYLRIIIYGFIFGTSVCVITVVVSILKRDKPSIIQVGLISYCLFTIVLWVIIFSFSTMLINECFDNSPETEQETIILTLTPDNYDRANPPTSSETDYTITLKSWHLDQRDIELCVSESEFTNYAIGDKLKVITKKGFLGIEYYTKIIKQK